VSLETRDDKKVGEGSTFYIAHFRFVTLLVILWKLIKLTNAPVELFLGASFPSPTPILQI
jgi:hypothetical protein